MLKTKTEKVYVILIAVFLLAIVCVVVFALVGRSDREEATPVPTATPQPTAAVVVREVEKLVEVEKVISSEMLQDGLNDMGVLVTEEYYFTEVMSFSSVKKFLKTEITLGFTESSYLASYDGIVTAGTDFTGITVEKDEAASRITIHIPPAEIRSVTIDPESFELYSEKVGLGNPLSVEDFNTSLIELENSARTKALDRGLLERADENARNVIGNFVGGLIDTSVWSLEFVTD